MLDAVRSSNISVRLVPPESGEPFMGRLEVFHDGVWGTVCDDFFGIFEADVVCGMLNYTEGSLCTVRSAGFGRGQGKLSMLSCDCQMISHDLQVKSGWTMWTVSRVMRFWKIAPSVLGERTTVTMEMMSESYVAQVS